VDPAFWQETGAILRGGQQVLRRFSSVVTEGRSSR